MINDATPAAIIVEILRFPLCTPGEDDEDERLEEVWYVFKHVHNVHRQRCPKDGELLSTNTAG